MSDESKVNQSFIIDDDWEAPAYMSVSFYKRMASMLRELEAHFRSDYHCCLNGKRRDGGHDTDCILERTATLLKGLP